MARDWETVAEEYNIIIMNQDVVIDEQRRKIKELEKELKDTISYYKSCMREMSEYHNEVLDDLRRGE